MKRHKWEKQIYGGKFSSFEISARCIVCGCTREKMFMGYKYHHNGETFFNAPPCVVLNAEAETNGEKDCKNDGNAV